MKEFAMPDFPLSLRHYVFKQIPYDVKRR